MSMPALRFKGFSDAWAETKIGEITTKVGSGSTPRGGVEVYQSAGIPFIRSQNVNNEQLLLNDITYISDEINNQMKGSLVKPNDILLNITGASIGRSCVVPLDFEMGNVNQHVCIIRLKPNYVPRFLQPYLSSSRGQKSISSTQGGSGREGLNFEAIRSFKVFTPTLDEQTKIASFLTVVDEKISQLTKKYDLLTQYKKGVMQQVFSQELRFKDDDGQDFSDWGQQKLGDISSFFSGGTPLTTNKSFYNGNVAFIKSGEIAATKTEQFITEASLKSSSAKMVAAGDLLYALYGATSGEVAISKINGAINQAVLCIRSKLNTYYLYSFLHFHKKSILGTYLQGGQGNLSAEIIKSLDVPCPCEKEQTKIANFLTAIDEKITNTQAELRAVKQYKQGLLQHLFV